MITFYVQDGHGTWIRINNDYSVDKDPTDFSDLIGMSSSSPLYAYNKTNNSVVVNKDGSKWEDVAEANSVLAELETINAKEKTEARKESVQELIGTWSAVFRAHYEGVDSSGYQLPDQVINKTIRIKFGVNDNNECIFVLFLEKSDMNQAPNQDLYENGYWKIENKRDYFIRGV